ncbi:hypothetical protein AB0K51_07045 [Kitasatospora sp. NPDC049285]|uniref:hypothetical protein n=1 Tax=Kitasatospora sp. NPDC049285 TaxID=3157096 RepID=UPI0034436FED
MSAETPEPGHEQAFADAIGLAAESYRIDPQPLADLGWSRGRRLRARRRVSLLGGVAALALIGVAGAGAISLPGGGGGAVGPGASGSAAAAVSGPEFQSMLTELLPAGQLVEVGEARGTENPIPQLRLVWDDGHGRVQYLFWIMKGDGGPTACDPTVIAGDACTDRTLADGTKVVVYQAGTRPGEPAGAKTWSVSASTADGYRLMLQEWNRVPLANGTPVTRTDPPLDQERLVALISDPRWKQVERSVREDRPEDGPAGMVGSPSAKP